MKNRLACCALTLKQEDSTADTTLRRFARLVQQISNPAPLQVFAEWTHFVCLTLSDLSHQEEVVRRASTGCDAVELRVDLLADHSPQSLQRQLALLRESIPEHMAVIYTVRSDHEGGKHPACSLEQYRSLLLEGLRGGVDCVDIEATKANHIMPHIDWTQYSACRLLSSKHDLNPLFSADESRLLALLEECATACPQADILKVVTVANNWQSAVQFSNAVLQIQAKWSRQPFICVAMGEAGSMTRVLNRVWTPVTHPVLSTKAAAGQLSLTQIMQLRRELNILTSKQYYLFGSDISRSPSPAMHNAVFEWFQLPYQYRALQTDQVTDLLTAMEADNFGGASVTMPYKEVTQTERLNPIFTSKSFSNSIDFLVQKTSIRTQAIVSHLDEVSGPAAAIGAVNTVAVGHTSASGGKKWLIGYNTDWIGITRPINSLLGKQCGQALGSMLIIGAGGTARAAAYAGQQLGMELLVHNRTASRAQLIVKDFGGIVVQDLTTIRADTLTVIISTITPSAQTELPEHLFQYKVIKTTAIAAS